jgi:hypothetical protein
MSDPKPPTPVVKTFLLCREIFQDAISREYILVAPYVDIASPQFPFVAPVNLYSQMTGLRGRYQLTLQVQDLENNVVWSHVMPQLFEHHDALRTCVLAFVRMAAWIPKPGKYDLVLLANGQDVARYAFMTGFPVNPVVPGQGAGG